jgi:hypothetical protein
MAKLLRKRKKVRFVYNKEAYFQAIELAQKPITGWQITL